MLRPASMATPTPPSRGAVGPGSTRGAASPTLAPRAESDAIACTRQWARSRRRNKPGWRIVINGLTLEAAPAAGRTKPKAGAAKPTRSQHLGCSCGTQQQCPDGWSASNRTGDASVSLSLQPALPATSGDLAERLDANQTPCAGLGTESHGRCGCVQRGRGRSLGLTARASPRDRPMPEGFVNQPHRQLGQPLRRRPSLAPRPDRDGPDMRAGYDEPRPRIGTDGPGSASGASRFAPRAESDVIAQRRQ